MAQTTRDAFGYAARSPLSLVDVTGLATVWVYVDILGGRLEFPLDVPGLGDAPDGYIWEGSAEFVDGEIVISAAQYDIETGEVLAGTGELELRYPVPPTDEGGQADEGGGGDGEGGGGGGIGGGGEGGGGDGGGGEGNGLIGGGGMTHELSYNPSYCDPGLPPQRRLA
jgi:hypothetical protein